jgi:hypothetical protein
VHLLFIFHDFNLHAKEKKKYSNMISGVYPSFLQWFGPPHGTIGSMWEKILILGEIIYRGDPDGGTGYNRIGAGTMGEDRGQPDEPAPRTGGGPWNSG